MHACISSLHDVVNLSKIMNSKLPQVHWSVTLWEKVLRHRKSTCMNNVCKRVLKLESMQVHSSERSVGGTVVMIISARLLRTNCVI